MENDHLKTHEEAIPFNFYEDPDNPFFHLDPEIQKTFKRSNKFNSMRDINIFKKKSEKEFLCCHR